jgi:hypothetical protein
LHGQTVYHHVNNTGVTELLDELANLKVIELNDAFKPYSRMEIATWLQQASENRGQLNKRQLQELDFYLKDFNKELKPDKDFDKRLDGYYHKDSLFTFSINPILGIQYWSNENGTAYHRRNGLQMFSYIGDRVGIYASLRDNHENKLLNDTAYLTPRTGANYKAQYDFSEMLGGLSYDWNWGRISVVKDFLQVGTNYHGANIVSGKAPSYAYVRLTIRPVHWLDFNYIHGWLVSEVVDSARSYTYAGAVRDVFHDKYMALNFFTLKPFDQFHFSFGNSIVYSDLGIHPAYLIPVMFFKSVDHTYNATTNAAGQNNTMFFDFSVRSLKHLHLYGTWFLDVITISTLFDENNHSNHWSMKGGLRISNLIPNVTATAEYTRTNPLAYKNDLETTQYESNHYNLGHYLRDNSDELYVSLSYKPIRAFRAQVYYIKARKGPDYPYIRERDETGQSLVLGKSFMESVEWQKEQIGFKINYQVINDGYVFLEYAKRTINGDQERYTPEIFYGNTNTWSVGLHLGF